MLWRAHLAKSAPKCNLGAEYGDAFRRYLIGSGDFPEQAAAIVSVYAPRSGETFVVGSLTTMPVTNKHEGYHNHRATVCGVQFDFAVGKRIPGCYRRFCLVRGAPRLVILAPQEVLLDWIGEFISGAPRSRKLAMGIRERAMFPRPRRK